MILLRRLPPRHSLPQITEDAVSKEIAGLGLSFQPGKDISWLTRTVREILEYSIGEKEYSAERTSNVDAEKEVINAAQKIRAAIEATDKLGLIARQQLSDYALAIANGGGPTEYANMLQTIENLRNLEKFLRQGADNFELQVGPWRQAEKKQLRIGRAKSLAATFELAFGSPPSANNYPNDARHKKPTQFMEFYSRIVTLAFGRQATTNLSGVCKEACKLHRISPQTEYIASRC